jgi:hypothetical protein
MAARLVACLALAVLAAGCGGSGKDRYTAGDVKASYYRAKDGGLGLTDYWVDSNFHSHANYVPEDGLETCPLAQRAEAASVAPNMVRPRAGQPVGQFVVTSARETDVHTPTVTQGAFVFGTRVIAARDMDTVGAAMARCPSSYEVRGGPPQILGTYSVSRRRLSLEGWEGFSQQVAHTYPPGQDSVYYEDMTHVVLQRANVILYVAVAHRNVIGQRADSSSTAQGVLKTVLKRLG